MKHQFLHSSPSLNILCHFFLSVHLSGAVCFVFQSNHCENNGNSAILVPNVLISHDPYLACSLLPARPASASTLPSILQLYSLVIYFCFDLYLLCMSLGRVYLYVFVCLCMWRPEFDDIRCHFYCSPYGILRYNHSLKLTQIS